MDCLSRTNTTWAPCRPKLTYSIFLTRLTIHLYVPSSFLQGFELGWMGTPSYRPAPPLAQTERNEGYLRHLTFDVETVLKTTGREFHL